jgi:hypothetical protein
MALSREARGSKKEGWSRGKKREGDEQGETGEERFIDAADAVRGEEEDACRM